MKKYNGRTLSRRIVRGLKIVSISALCSLVVLCSPQAVCHVSASGPVRFSTYLMINEDGDFATDSAGEYIQLFDEKGNLLAYNEDVKEFLKNSGSKKLAAKEKEFFLIDGKLYLDESGNDELTDLSKVMPAMFKYDTIDSGYTLEADSGTVYIDPLDVDGDSVYVARIAGNYEKLPAFTISESGDIGYLERGSVSNGDKEVSFVYDSNYFYDENLNELVSMNVLVPETGDESAPMFTGFYIKNAENRRQLLDVDGSIVMPAADYKSMAKNGASVEAEYCNLLTLSAEGADSMTLYSDIDDGILYNDYQRMDTFRNIGGDLLSQLWGDEGRGYFAGYYYAADEDGSVVRFIDESGNLIEGSIGALGGNREYAARFYHVLGVDGESAYISDGNVYSDQELLNPISNIAEITGGIPEDETEEVHSDEKDMDGVVTRYFIGYYFATDFWDEEDEASMEREMLLSEYDEEDFDPANIELNKIKFADREGNIVFDPSSAPDIEGDMGVYQNWFTVTVWDDGEVEIAEDCDEAIEDPKDTDEETDEDIEAIEEQSEEEPSDDEQPGEGNPEEGQIGEGETGEGQTSEIQPDETAAENGENPENEDDKSGIEENAIPSDEEDGVSNDSEPEDNGGDDVPSGGNDEQNSSAPADMDMDIPRTQDDGE